MSDYEARFSGIRRLYSSDGLERLRRAHVCVIGIGGVGSWAVEAFARSGIGSLTLVDLDDLCVSNINRQIHALDRTVGRPKVQVMAERIHAVSPGCSVTPVHAFFTEANAHELLQTRFDYVLDAIDSPSKKCLLITSCRERSIPVFVVGAAGGRRNSTALKVSDLAFSTHDPLLQAVRSTLRSEFSFPRQGKPFGV